MAALALAGLVVVVAGGLLLATVVDRIPAVRRTLDALLGGDQ